MIGAEVQHALARHPALPATAGELRHQHLLWREAEVQLELLESLPEPLRVLLLGRLATPRLLRDQTLKRRTGRGSGERGRDIEEETNSHPSPLSSTPLEPTENTVCGCDQGVINIGYYTGRYFLT